MAVRDTAIDLYELLPAFYRVDDAGRGYPLKKLLDLLSEQANLLKDDVSGLWDDQFIETCADWVIPYIGDLVSNRALHEAVRGRRADVAKTIYYRRRKGTLPMLEELARDVTGWGAHAVAFFEQLGWTQNLNHLRFRAAPNPGRLNPNAWDRVGTAHIRNLDAMDLLDGPFDYTTHTIDVRRIRRLQGWHNIRNIGFFLWRLLSNPATRSDPRPSSLNGFGYHFSPLGNPAPLFTRPAPEFSETGLAGEIHVPGPIRPLAFHLDRGAFYGEDRSFVIYLDNALGDPEPIPLEEITCLDLSQWERPPAGVSGVFSADLAAFPGLGGVPQLNVTIGGIGPVTVTLQPPFANLNQARSSLEAAIRAANPDRAFEGVRVIRTTNRLLILPGLRGASVAFGPAPADAVSIVTLGLNAAIPALGLLSGDLLTFPDITDTAPEVQISIGGVSHIGSLGALPIPDLATARARLEAAIQSGPNPGFVNAQVLVVDNRLLVLPGVDGDPVIITATFGDPTTAGLLRLTSKVGIDVHRGRFAFPIALEPAPSALSVSYRYGFSDATGGGAYDRRRRAALGVEVDPTADTVRFPDAFLARINVPQDFPTVAAAVAAWNPVADPRMVIQVNDSRSYAGNVVINIPSGQLVIQAANRARPTLLGNLTVNAASASARLRLDGFWVEGGLRVTGTLGELEIAHCRFVPGLRLDEQGEPVFPDSPSLIAESSNDRLYITVDRSILGPLQIAEEAVELRVNDSIIDSPRSSGDAEIIPALLSGDLIGFAGTTAAAPHFLAAFGDDGPVDVAPGPIPALAAAALALNTAITGADPSPGFVNARVQLAGNRILILSGNQGSVSIQSTATDTTTAAELRLRAADSRSIFALRSGPLPVSTPLSNPAPRLNVTFGTGATFTINLAAGAKTPAGLRAELAALLPTCIVLLQGTRLLILPPGEGDAVVFTAHDLDATTVNELQLDSARPAIAASLGGEHPAPNATLQRTTLLGASHFRQITLASEVIFLRRTVAARRQTGCVRFSSIAHNSRTPRRYRCQPDLALENVSDPAERLLIRLRLSPVFTSTRSGDPGYAQLALSCDCLIKTGGENGAEMGAFNLLMQPQREANLRIRLEEYLPLGLQPGFIYVT